MVLKKLLSILAAAMALAPQAMAEELPKQPNLERVQALRNQRTFLMNCINASVERFDDHISPANVVADAVAWYCEAERDPENYWSVLSQRRSTPDTVVRFYRDLALPFVLQSRAKRLWGQ
jgi:hypothetical protein